ncbi:MAG TPA: oligopeptide/dipeptide ABC transporter ATP-binding protein [Candidatus Limnocylindrales bacterium]|jgi:oligopeptide/dipeptide ABC transporter ATP-binding protein
MTQQTWDDGSAIVPLGDHVAVADEAAQATDDRVLVRVEHVVKHFPIRGGTLGVSQIGAVRAVDDVSFDVRRGETLGLVGESGCGKTTLGKVILRLIPATSGQVYIDDRALFDLNEVQLKAARRDLQIVFQDPYASLNPRMTVGEIVGEGPLVHGLTDRAKREELVRELLAKVGLNQTHIRRYPHEFSGGQRQRIGIARALALNPEFIVCDEPVSALDVSIQSQVLNLLNDLQQELGLTYLFIAHNLAVVEHISDRVGVMYLGRLVELATVDELYINPRHPYSVALLSAVPEPDPRRRKKRLVLSGDVPSPAAPPSGCRFNTRCWLKVQLGNPERCTTEEPELHDVGGGHLTACHFDEEVTPAAVATAAERQLPVAQA